MCPCRAFNECFFLCVFVRYLVFFCDIWVLRDTTFSAKKQKTEKKLIRKRLGKGTLNMCAKCQGLTLENGVDIWTFLRLRAVLNAAIFFLILPPNVWSQEAARIKRPGMKIPKKNTRYSGVLHAIPHYARLKASEVLLLSATVVIVTLTIGDAGVTG